MPVSLPLHSPIACFTSIINFILKYCAWTWSIDGAPVWVWAPFLCFPKSCCSWLHYQVSQTGLSNCICCLLLPLEASTIFIWPIWLWEYIMCSKCSWLQLRLSLYTGNFPKVHYWHLHHQLADQGYQTEGTVSFSFGKNNKNSVRSGYRKRYGCW